MAIVVPSPSPSSAAAAGDIDVSLGGGPKPDNGPISGSPLAISNPKSDGARLPPSNFRFTVVIMLMLCNASLYISRANMSIAAVFMWPKRESAQSLALAGFYAGYPLLQLAGGTLTRTCGGGKKLLNAAVITWSLAGAAVLPVYEWTTYGGNVDPNTAEETITRSALAVFFCRMLLGVSEGLNYPAQTDIIQKWIPVEEYSSAWSWAVGGENFGTILAMFMCPFLAGCWGWHSIFWVSTVTGFVWLLAFNLMVEQDPCLCGPDKQHVIIVAVVDAGSSGDRTVDGSSEIIVGGEQRTLARGSGEDDAADVETQRDHRALASDPVFRRNVDHSTTYSYGTIVSPNSTIITSGVVVPFSARGPEATNDIVPCSTIRATDVRAQDDVVVEHSSCSSGPHASCGVARDEGTQQRSPEQEITPNSRKQRRERRRAGETSLSSSFDPLSWTVAKLRRYCRLTDEEREYIRKHRAGGDDPHRATPASDEEATSAARKKSSIPYCEILTSKPFWLNMSTHFAFNWAYYLMLSVLPGFFAQRYHVQYSDMAFASVAPYLCALAVSVFAGWFGDRLLRQHFLGSNKENPTPVRKLYVFLAQGVQSLSLVVLAFAPSSAVGDDDPGPLIFAVFVVCVGVGFSSFNFSGCFSGYGDLSPGKYGATVMALGNAMASTPGLFGNLSVSVFGGDFTKVFLFSAVVELGGMLPFLLWGDLRDQCYGELEVVGDEKGGRSGGGKQEGGWRGS